jgi:hypothetical protein
VKLHTLEGVRISPSSGKAYPEESSRGPDLAGSLSAGQGREHNRGGQKEIEENGSEG